MGQYTSIIEIQTNVEKALKDIIELQGRVDKLEGKEYKVELGVDSKKLESVINNLEKMLKSLGKGTGDFKQFETLSQELSGVSKEIQSIGKAFGNIDDSGTKTLLSSIQSIDQSLVKLSQHITGINADFGSIGKNASDNVGQINEAKKATEGLTDATKDLAKAQDGIKSDESLIDSSSTVSEVNKIKQKVKASSIFKDLIDVSDVKSGSNELNAALATSMKNLKALYSSGKTESLEYYAELYKIIEIQKKMWQFNGMGKKSSFDATPNVKDATERMKVQDNIFADFKQYGNVASEVVDFVIGEFSRLKNAGEGIFKENGKLISKETLIGSMDLLFDELYVKNLKRQEQQALATAEAEQKLANVEQQSSNSSIAGNQDKIQQELKETEQVAEQTSEALEKVNSASNKSNISSKATTPSSDVQNDSSLIEQNKAATEQAVQSKREFAAANEGVQNSVAESKSALQLEAELMSQLAKDAREAANAKQAFVEANKQVEQSANNSNNSTKKNRYKNYTEMSEDDYMSKYSKLSSTANKFLSDRGYEILGGSVGVKFSNGFARVSAEIKDAEGNWKRFSASVDADSKVFNARFNPITEGINKLNSKLENFGKDVVQSETKKVFDESDLKSFEADVTSLQSKLKKSFSGSDLDKQKFINSLEDIMSRYKKFKDLFDDGEIDTSNWNKLQRYFESFQKSIDQYSTEKLNPDGKSKKYLDELEKAKALLNELKIIIGQDGFEGVFSEDELGKIGEFIQKIKELHSLGTSKEGKEGNKASFQNILGETEEFLWKNTKMSKELRVQFEALAAEMKAFGDSVPSGDKLVEFRTRLETLKTKAKETGQVGLSFFDGIAKKARSMSEQFIAMYFSLYDIYNYVKTGFNYVKELDTAYTEMRKVSDESESTLKNYQASTFDVANEVGTTAVQIQNSTADFMRLGESINEAAESAKTANILLNVSEFDSIDSATESLIAMSAAYDELDKIEIVDKLNNVGKSIVAQTYDNIWGYKYISASSYNG